MSSVIIYIWYCRMLQRIKIIEQSMSEAANIETENGVASVDVRSPSSNISLSSNKQPVRYRPSSNMSTSPRYVSPIYDILPRRQPTPYHPSSSLNYDILPRREPVPYHPSRPKSSASRQPVPHRPSSQTSPNYDILPSRQPVPVITYPSSSCPHS